MTIEGKDHAPQLNADEVENQIGVAQKTAKKVATHSLVPKLDSDTMTKGFLTKDHQDDWQKRVEAQSNMGD